MKVIHLISGGDTGGARTHVHLLLKHLNLTEEATLVCFTDGPFARDAAALGIPTVVLGGSLPGTLRKLCAMVREGQYQVIHCHGSRGNLMGALLKPFVKIPVISTVHSDPKLDYMGRPGAGLVYGGLNAFALRRMDYHIGVSDSMRELLMARGFRPHKIFTIYNGVEFSDTPAAPADRAAFYARVGLNAPAGSIVVGIGARLHPVKDYPTLLRGFAKARKTHPELRLLIAGDGQERSALEALTRELGIGEAVCFAGWLTDMREFYRCIDINALTSLSETFPYAITEAAREHLPTVSSRVGGIPAIILPGETGLLFEPGDDETLGDHLAALAGSAELRERLGEALYKKANEEFSAEATCRRQIEIYRRVIRTEEKLARGGRFGVLLCGAYGMHNAGDEAILEAVVSEMREIDPDMPITVMSRSASETARRCGVEAINTFNIPCLLRTLRRRELYINGGGSLLQDVTSSRSLWYYLFTLDAAKRRGCKVMMYGCGVGPVSGRLNRRLTAAVVNRSVDAVTLREADSMAQLRAFGITVPDVSVASDPALSLDPAGAEQVDGLMRRLGMDPAGQYLCLSLRRWAGIRDKLPLFAAAADYAYETCGLTPVLLSVNPRQDDRSTEALRSLIHAPCITVQEPMDTAAMSGLIGRMRAVCAMRLHVLIFAAARAVPLAAVSYDPKVASFLECLGQNNYLDYEALSGPEQLFALVDGALQAEPEALRDATARLRAAERRNPETARRLLGRGEGA